jgi:uncharacterized protein (DUF1800 family)
MSVVGSETATTTAGNDALAVDWTAANAAHLYRRAGFGASPKQLEQALKQGFEKTLAALLKPDKPLPKPPKKVLQDLTRLQTWWLDRMVKSKHPLSHRLTLFWHNHFATANSKVQDLGAMHAHVRLLHDNALGDFGGLVLGVSRDPAMLVWLDNWQNFADSINENYARELMELFTTGVLDQANQPNYSEADVVAVARAFTGWTLDGGEFLFAEWGHDHGLKTFKGETADFDGTDILDRLVDDPATARRLAMKLWSHFAYPVALDDPLLDGVAQAYVDSGHAIAPMVEAIFRHDAFWSDTARRALVKGPAEFLVGSARMLGAKLRKDHAWEIGNALAAMGQSLYSPPSVFGWDEGLAWVAASGLLERAATAEALADARGKYAAYTFKPDKLLGKKKEWAGLGASGAVARLLEAADLPEASPATVAALEAYAAADENGQPQPVTVDATFADVKARGILALILSSPEYQLA